MATSCTSCYFFCCQCPRLWSFMTEQKAIRLTLWSPKSPRCLKPRRETLPKTLPSTYTTQQEINTFTPSRCSLLLSLPWLMRELLFLAEGLFLTPSRSQMTVFAAWGPDPSSPDPVTGSVEPFHSDFNIKRGRRIKLDPEDKGSLHGLK